MHYPPFVLFVAFCNKNRLTSPIGFSLHVREVADSPPAGFVPHPQLARRQLALLAVWACPSKPRRRREEQTGPLTANGTEAEDVALVVRGGPPARVGATRGVRGVVPAPAPDGPGRARRIPAPLHHISRHVVQPIAVRAETAHRTRVGIAARRVRRVIAARSADVVAVQTGAVIVRLTMRDRIAPREAFSGKCAARHSKMGYCVAPSRIILSL
jgi:hypothetical protein